MRPLLITFTNLGLGGVQRKIVDIANFLASVRPDLPIYILLRNREDYDLSYEIKNKNVKIINYQDWLKIKIPFFFPFFEIYQIWRIKPQAILSFLDFVSLPAVLAKLLFLRKVRLVLSEDHYTSKVVPSFNFGHFRSFLMKIFYPFADVVFTCSEATKRDLIKNYNLPAEKLKVIRNWTTFIERKRRREEKYDLIYIGRFFWTKNLSFLIGALKKLKKKKRNISLCLLGRGQEKTNLLKLVEKYSLKLNVSFVEPSRQVDKFLACSRIFVICSKVKAEGFPMVILEAMAMKTPVLARDFAGAKEFLKDGQNCYLFKTEKEFIKKVIWLLNNPQERKKIAKKAYRDVKKYHSPDNILAYLQALNI